MIAFLVKVLSSAVVIGLVTEVARRSPSLGGVLSALPVVSLISFAWLVKQGSERTELSTFLKSVLLGLPATFFIASCLVLAHSLRDSCVFQYSWCNEFFYRLLVCSTLSTTVVADVTEKERKQW
ncbi:MAG TPA: hypothetical protein DCE40_06295 [Exiguobacterium sp.]|nr:hypothetical protein [Exiguobacterium sp.]HAZ38353.1 hypothetical protein [Exiguobacterium sp.]